MFMRRRTLSVLAVVLPFLVSVGCASPGGLIGGLYTGVSLPQGATAQPKGDKMGESCAMSLLGIIAIGDASIETARKNGRISKITSVDTNYTQILGLYASNCTVVRGK